MWHNDNNTQVGIDCVSPASPLSATGKVTLQISGNGQQYTDAASWMYYGEPSSAYATPRAGPIDGGALITLRGENLFGGSDYRCRVGGIVVPASFSLSPSERVQCRSPNVTDASIGYTTSPIEVALNAQQFVPLNAANGSFYVYAPPTDAQAEPQSGPANGGTVVEINVPGGGLGLASSANAALSYFCTFGHVERSGHDEMLMADRMGVSKATWLSDSTLKCVSPSAEDAGAAEFLRPLMPPPQPLNILGAASVASHQEAAAMATKQEATLTGSAGECGSLLMPAVRGGSGIARASWIEHTMEVRATMPIPAWGGRGQRVASMGGFSWSYGELPAVAAPSVIGSAGAGLGLRFQLTPREDGHVQWQVRYRETGRIGGAILPKAERDAIVAEEWRTLRVRIQQRDLAAESLSSLVLHVSLGNLTLLDAAPLNGYEPLNEWSVALGACGVAPEPSTHSGRWYVANLTMRSGARFRYADEPLTVSLNGQQLTPTANLTFRYYAAPLPTQLTPASGPVADAGVEADRYASMASSRAHAAAAPSS